MTIQRRTFRILPIAIVLLLSAAAGTTPFEDDLLIVGRVVDDATSRPIESAQVYVEGTTAGALTNREGRYRLSLQSSDLPVGAVVTAQMIGYSTEHARLAQSDDTPASPSAAPDSVTIDFRLRQQALFLDEIVVGGTVTSAGRPAAEAPRAVVTGSARRPQPSSPPAAAVSATVSADRRSVRPGPRGYDREQYGRISENGFRSVRDHPLSTFSTDVDRASYSNIRRFILRERRLPPIDAVQVEEMINYFSWDYAEPEGRDPVAITTEVGPAPWSPRHRLLRIGLATRPLVAEELPANNLVFLIDVSGSMGSDDKLPLVKRSLRLLVEQLRPIDRVAIVTYAGRAGLVLESTSGRDKDRILEAIDRLEDGGSTAGGAGLRLAYQVARENLDRRGNNRVILATDGDFNVGESSDAAMVRLIEEKREGTFLTVLGFGTGNLQSEKMQSLAQHGNGNYAYIDRMAEARKVFVSEMGGTLLTVAKDVKLQIEFNPAQVAAYRLIGYENRLLANEDFNDDAKDAGDIGSGHRVTALYEIVPGDADSGFGAPGVDPLRYQTPAASRSRADQEIAFVRLRYKRPDSDRSRLLEQPIEAREHTLSSDFHFVTAVAGFGMLLRDSEHRGSMSVDRILALAADGVGPDLDGYRQGFIEIVEAYRDITTHTVRRR